MEPKPKLQESKAQSIKAETFDLITQRGKLEQTIAFLNQKIQGKVKQINALEAKPNDTKDKGQRK